MPSTIPPSPGPGYTWNGTVWIPPTGGTNIGQSVQTTAQTAQIVPGVPQTGNQMNVIDAAGQITTNPSLLLNQDNPNTPNVNESMELADRVPTVNNTDVNAGTIDKNSPAYQQSTGPNATTTNAQVTNANGPTGNTTANGVTTATTQQDVSNAAMTGAQGSVSNQSQIDANAVTTDTNAIANGETGTGQALKQAAIQNISNIIDTSSASGKLLAQTLGEGNYTDAKATLKGQLDILQGEFFDAAGNPMIPSWAAGTARSVGRIAAFKGMTGTAATAAMAQALMEASLPIAQEDAKFFQTVTLQNLSNRQEQTINRANVLSKLDMQNMDARLTAAVNNSQSFLKMDLANLDNDQQARVINTQARVQSILEDAKSENANRLFVADSQNQKDMFYSNLESSIEQFNAAQSNNMAQFNSGEANDASQFNAQLENAREEFYKNMQFAIDTSNVKWRQTITMTENQQKFDAAATDVKNMVGISVEQLNRIWDRADALLDYAWKTADNEADRKNQLAMVKLQGKLSNDAADSAGWGNILGTVLGAGADALFGWLF